MKKILCVAFLCLSSVTTYAQSAKEMLLEIENKWELDDNNNVTFSRVIDVPNLNKDEIFNRVLSFFTYNYVSGKSVIQIQDKEAGLVVGKGVYDNVHIGYSIVTTYVDAWHILRVDVKEGKARVIVSLTDYEKKIVASNAPSSFSSMKIATEYPINPKGGQKTVMTKAFYKSYQKAYKTLDAVEKAIKEGNTSKVIENSEW